MLLLIDRTKPSGPWRRIIDCRNCGSSHLVGTDDITAVAGHLKYEWNFSFHCQACGESNPVPAELIPERAQSQIIPVSA